MDRFKFRAWHRTMNKMYYDSFFVGFDGQDYSWNYEETEITPNVKNCLVLMQCTGLKDKNGKLIYEGDIVLDKLNNIKYCLIYKAGHGYLAKRMDAKTPTYFLEVLKMSNADFEDGVLRNFKVIGNIYSNPDLLERKE